MNLRSMSGDSRQLDIPMVYLKPRSAGDPGFSNLRNLLDYTGVPGLAADYPAAGQQIFRKVEFSSSIRRGCLDKSQDHLKPLQDPVHF